MNPLAAAAVAKETHERIVYVRNETPWLRILGVIVLCLWLLWHYFIQPAVTAVDKVTPWDGLLPFAPISCTTPPTPVRTTPVGWDGMVYDFGRLWGRLAKGDIPHGSEYVAFFRGTGEQIAHTRQVLDDGVQGRVEPIPLAPPPPPPAAAQVSTSDALTDQQVVAFARAVGWPEEEIRSGRLGARVLAESGNRPTAADPVTGTHLGLLQMGAQERAQFGVRNPADPRESLAGALGLWKARGWQPWRASDGLVGQYLGRAQQAAAGSVAAVPAASCTPPTPGSSGAMQVTWQNGRAPAGSMVRTSLGVEVRADVAASLERLQQAFTRANGQPLVATDGYRSYEAQVDVARRKPTLAAVPGTSNHGWGLAVDLAGPASRNGTPQHQWLLDNAPEFGWENPAWAQPGQNRVEPWHLEVIDGGAKQAG